MNGRYKVSRLCQLTFFTTMFLQLTNRDLGSPSKNRGGTRRRRNIPCHSLQYQTISSPVPNYAPRYQILLPSTKLFSPVPNFNSSVPNFLEFSIAYFGHNLLVNQKLAVPNLWTTFHAHRRINNATKDKWWRQRPRLMANRNSYEWQKT